MSRRLAALFDTRPGFVRHLAPGLLLCFTVAAAATFLGEHYGAPVMLFALLIGMAFHFLSTDAKCQAGIDFTAKRLLRVGVALLGVRVTLDQIFALGLGPVLLVIACLVATLAVGVVIARAFGRGRAFGILTGGAVAICGASAALAISAALPRYAGKDRDTLFTVIAVATLSTVAMVLYPVLFAVLGFDDVESGILIGATIHDVAQVVGAGYAVSPEAGDVATYVKLLRVTMLPVVVVVIALVASRMAQEGAAAAPLPLFAFGFVALLLANSFGLIPAAVVAVLDTASRWLLVGAIAALGIKTSLKAMVDLGPVPLAIVVGETLFLLALAVGLLMLL
ncbi:MAG: putative sulfate exporter family transporter [Geminicoccaceae bacterium]|nr:MAG: putative sulfate exporter family transporter [Geminicoccaceae bacterium]